MADAYHPNQFAVEQQVLFRQKHDDVWREGTINGVARDHRTSRTHDDGMFRTGHDEHCDEFLYSISDNRFDALITSERPKPTINCMCDVRIVDADPTGRWHDQRLVDPESLALLRVDARRRGDKITPVWVEHAHLGDLMYFQLDHQTPARANVTLAWATVADLLAWASGVPDAEREEPTE